MSSGLAAEPLRPTVAPLPRPAGRLGEIDRAKGVAMLLVVIGHLSWGAPPGNPWYDTLKNGIYLFHMPFFLFLSGFMFFYAHKPLTSAGQYFKTVGRRAGRILPGYLIYGLAALCGKLALASFGSVQTGPSSFWGGFVNLLCRPVKGPAIQLWYLYVVMLYSLAMPLVLTAAGRYVACLLPVALAAHFLKGSTLFASDFLLEYMFVIVLGCVAAQHYDGFRRMVVRFRLLWLAVFVAALAAVMVQ